ncbi:hypothetical protein [Acinetobacter shaoyimingii]|uniref:Uncharacterized protein n=1 Tax=Acinetobacter shaoyimingii TaxID=2715164 RepID=A0A6G8RUP1_9GAMM|nr:hypothetical protein [Acinetobacter shaoyimingii]QIO05597.1 hypothetical protein G8E00_06340 [Acinetobacter shaoyimingii]
MIIFRSVKTFVISFMIVTLLIACGFWLYLNLIASVHMSAQQTKIQLPQSLPTKIEVGNYLEAHSQGRLNTKIKIDRNLTLPLKGKYLANLSFDVETPVSVSVDYQTSIKIDEVLPLEADTDLIYQSKLLPKFPLKLEIPIQLDVPFHLKKTYNIPIRIMFNGPVYFEFDEPVRLHVLHEFAPELNINDPMTMRNIATFRATMTNRERETRANLDMDLDFPVRNIRP